MWLNLLYMLPLSLLPFGAALIARHAEEAVALRIYGLLLVAIALTRLLVWLYATNRPHLLFDPIDPELPEPLHLAVAGAARRCRA